MRHASLRNVKKVQKSHQWLAKERERKKQLEMANRYHFVKVVEDFQEALSKACDKPPGEFYCSKI